MTETDKITEYLMQSTRASAAALACGYGGQTRRGFLWRVSEATSRGYRASLRGRGLRRFVRTELGYSRFGSPLVFIQIAWLVFQIVQWLRNR